MFGNKKTKAQVAPYKGVRDFYPEDMRVRKYIFDKAREAVEKFGYEEYDASVLEPTELYTAKTSEEILSEQTYTFKDRGDRSVTLRPEMTPTVARMVAAKRRELPMPLRWYSTPNLFRYEQPQRGRMREHWQFNADLFGGMGVPADAEILTLAREIMHSLEAKDSDFIIKINDRRIIKELFGKFGIKGEDALALGRVIDKKEKVSAEVFHDAVAELLGKNTGEFLAILDNKEALLETLGESPSVKYLFDLIETLKILGVSNIAYTPTLTRGFDYYTGLVFEVFDTDPDNRRSLFGGGRYDELLDMFGAPETPAIGFGMGDVTIRDFLETHNLLPNLSSILDVYIGILGEGREAHASKLAMALRAKGVRVIVDVSGKSAGDQIKIAEKKGAPAIIFVGEEEAKTGRYKIKRLATGAETEATEGNIPEILAK